LQKKFLKQLKSNLIEVLPKMAKMLKKPKKGYIIAYLAKKLHPMPLNITFKWS